jgi:gluconolactonase
MQDGSNDLNIYGGDWWMANQTLERALTFSGYEVEHVWGDGGHNGQQGTQVFPDAMRWLWKDWPQRVKGGTTRNNTITALVIPGEDWQEVGAGLKTVGAPAVNAKGEVIFQNGSSSGMIGADGRPVESMPRLPMAEGQAFGPDGRLYGVSSKGDLNVSDPAGKSTSVRGVRGSDVVVANNGNAYVVQAANGREAGRIWLVRPDGKKQVVDTGIAIPGGVTLSPDQTLLYVNDARSHWVYSYQVQSDGTLLHKQRYYWLHSPDTEDATGDTSGAGGMRVDREGRLYVATTMGIQVCDQAGRKCHHPDSKRQGDGTHLWRRELRYSVRYLR